MSWINFGSTKYPFLSIFDNFDSFKLVGMKKEKKKRAVSKAAAAYGWQLKNVPRTGFEPVT